MALDNRRIMRIYGALAKRAAAVLTPEAEQAAVGAPMDPGMAQGGQPMDPAAGAGAPPMDPAAAGPMQAQGPNGAQIPPEVLQDQAFIQWLASMGIQFDPQSGMFYDQTGQPVPAEVIMQAYSEYQAQSQGGAMPPAGGGAPAPADPAAAGGMPPADQGAMPPADHNAMSAGDPAAMGGQPPMPPQGGQLPPEVLQDQMFVQFLQEAMGCQVDPASGTVIDVQSGQQIPPDAVMQAYQAFQQQMAQMQGGQPPMDAGAGAPPAEQGGAPAPEGGAGMGAIAPGGDMLQELQKMVDTALETYTAQIDKKIETLIDKLDTVKMALEAIRDTDDKRGEDAKNEEKAMREEIAADLQPTEKVASVQPAPVAKPRQTKCTSTPVNIFDLIMNKR